MEGGKSLRNLGEVESSLHHLQPTVLMFVNRASNYCGKGGASKSFDEGTEFSLNQGSSSKF